MLLRWTRNPQSHAEHGAGIHQQTRIALDLLLEPHAPEAWALRNNLYTGTSTQARRGEHVLPGRDRLLKDFGFDLPIKAIVRSSITLIGNGAFTVPEMLRQSEQARAVPQRRKLRRFCGPDASSVARTAFVGKSSQASEARNKQLIHCGRNLQLTGTYLLPLRGANARHDGVTQIVALGLGAMPRGQCFKDSDCLDCSGRATQIMAGRGH